MNYFKHLNKTVKNLSKTKYHSESLFFLDESIVIANRKLAGTESPYNIKFTLINFLININLYLVILIFIT